MTNRRSLSRRETLGTLSYAALSIGFGAENSKDLRIGVMDGILGLACQPESVAVAASLGLTGVQVTIGSPQPSDHLLLSDTTLQRRFVEASKSSGVALPNTYLDILHKDCLKSDSAQALRWIREGVNATKALGANVLMLVFFGKCAVGEEKDRQTIISPLREASRMADDAGIVLGFETTISGARESCHRGSRQLAGLEDLVRHREFDEHGTFRCSR